MQRQALKRLFKESVAEEDQLKRKDLFSTVVSASPATRTTGCQF